MSDTRDHRVTLRLTRGYEFVAEFDNADGHPPIFFDEPPPLGAGLAPNAATVLGAAVADCLSASLVFCLRKVRLDVVDLTAHVVTHVTRNEKGRFRVSGIDVEINPVLSQADAARFKRCEGLYEDFCVVTESIRHGIPVNVTIGEAEAVKEVL